MRSDCWKLVCSIWALHSFLLLSNPVFSCIQTIFKKLPSGHRRLVLLLLFFLTLVLGWVMTALCGCYYANKHSLSGFFFRVTFPAPPPAPDCWFPISVRPINMLSVKEKLLQLFSQNVAIITQYRPNLALVDMLRLIKLDILTWLDSSSMIKAECPLSWFTSSPPCCCSPHSWSPQSQPPHLIRQKYKFIENILLTQVAFHNLCFSHFNKPEHTQNRVTPSALVV